MVLLLFRDFFFSVKKYHLVAPLSTYPSPRLTHIHSPIPSFSILIYHNSGWVFCLHTYDYVDTTHRCAMKQDMFLKTILFFSELKMILPWSVQATVTKYHELGGL